MNDQETYLSKVKREISNKRKFAYVVIFFISITSLALLLDSIDSIFSFASKRVRPLIENKPVVFEYFDEIITFGDQSGMSLHDSVKIYGAHSRDGGMTAQKFWLTHNYPDYEFISGQLVGSAPDESSNILLDFGNRQAVVDFSDLPSTNDFVVDIITIETKSGKIKEIYFDISSYYDKPFKDPILAEKVKRLAKEVMMYNESVTNK